MLARLLTLLLALSVAGLMIVATVPVGVSAADAGSSKVTVECPKQCVPGRCECTGPHCRGNPISWCDLYISCNCWDGEGHEVSSCSTFCPKPWQS